MPPLILGAGASGLAAAAFFARHDIPFLLIERLDRVGKKLLSTGNGRCNYSNLDMNPAHYGAAADFVQALYEATPPETVHAFWASLGLLHAEEEGRLYPRTMSASSVLDALRKPLERVQSQILTDAEVVRLERTGGGWQVFLADGRTLCGERVLACMGGSAAPKFGTDGAGAQILKALGLNIAAQAPALVQLRCAAPRVSLKGLRVHAAPTLVLDGQEVAREEGELLFTDYGVSGVCVLQLSSLAARALLRRAEVSLRIDLLPECPQAAWLDARLSEAPEETVSQRLVGVFPRLLTQEILKAAHIPMTTTGGALSEAERARLFAAIHTFAMEVVGTKGYDAAQVSSGGVRLREVDPKTMAAKRFPGLYLAGELLDVDGPCGGYNLHFAIASGLTAARAMLSREE